MYSNSVIRNIIVYITIILYKRIRRNKNGVKNNASRYGIPMLGVIICVSAIRFHLV